MLPRSESLQISPFNEFVGLLDMITEIPLEKPKIKSGFNTNRFPPKIDLSTVTGKIKTIRVSKSLIRQLIYKSVPYPVCPYKVYHVNLLRDISVPPTDSQIK